MDEKATTLECSNCSKKLVEVWVKNSENKKTKLRAECCYCGDKSYAVEIKGDFYVGGTDFASVDGIEEKNGTQIIKTAGIRQ
tara:strand:+ start:1413 stop:1658 length:246 start_codon:yes stop_codon:yes gene_type:complete